MERIDNTTITVRDINTPSEQLIEQLDRKALKI